MHFYLYIRSRLELVLMNKYEFEAIKAELARNILNSDDEALIEHLRHCYAESQGQGAPCRYTLNEVKARLRSTEADAIAGRGLSEAEVDRLMEAMI